MAPFGRRHTVNEQALVTALEGGPPVNSVPSPSKNGGDRVMQQHAAAMREQIEQIQMNSITVQAQLEKQISTLRAQLDDVVRQQNDSKGSSFLKKTTAAKVGAAITVMLYIQKTVGSGKVSKLGYSKALRHLHLLMGLGIIGGIASIRQAKRCDGLEKKMWVDIHKGTGVFTLVSLFVRLGLRIFSPIPPRFPGPKALQISESASHYLFYLAMLVLPGSGVVYTYLNGSGIPYVGWTKPDIEDADMEKAQQALDLHRMLGKIMERAWLPFHFATAAWHSYKGRSVVRKITPFP